MAISYISSASAQASTATLGTNIAGDIIVVFAHRDGSTTAPSLATGYTNIANPAGANTNSHRIGYKISTGSEANCGTWTNATSVSAVVLRGQHSSPIGANASGSASSSTIAYNTITLQVTDGTSWVVGGAGHRTATNLNQAPSGMTLRSSTNDVNICDTNGGVSSWSTNSITVNASSGWRSHTVEIKAAPTSTSVSLERSTRGWMRGGRG